MKDAYRLTTRLTLAWLIAASCLHNSAAAQSSRFDASASEASSRLPIDILRYDARIGRTLRVNRSPGGL